MGASDFPVCLSRTPNLVDLRAYRKSRVQQALVRRGLAGIVLFNPVNIRYACDARNMQVYGLHNPCRYVFMACLLYTSPSPRDS